MTTETGNAQNEVADPSQDYGLAKWLAGQQFSQQRTPTATYGGPGAGQMSMAQQAVGSSLPEMSRFGDMPFAGGEREGSMSGGFSNGGAASFGATKEKFASPFNTSNYGRYGSTIGSVLGGPLGGAVGAAAGGYFDIDNFNKQQASLGFAGPMTNRQMGMGLLNKASPFGILGTSWEDASISNLLDAVAAYEQANPELMNKLNQDSWSDDQGYGWDGGYGGWAGREFARDDDDRDGPGSGGEAQGGRGGADGGGWD
jgi:hypothetical protein